jgi:transcription antitermination factor NusG
MAAALYSIGDFVEFVKEPVMSIPIPKLWYLLRLHPNFDLKAERQLHERGISAYVPKEKVTVRAVWHRNKSVQKIVPIFPGAMFIPDFDADIERLKRCAGGIGGFVKCAGQALRISLRTMEDIRRFEAKRDAGKRKFEVNQRIRVVGGPFDMLEGSIERLDPKYRIRVLIEFLGGQSTFELDEDQVEAV